MVQLTEKGPASGALLVIDAFKGNNSPDSIEGLALTVRTGNVALCGNKVRETSLLFDAPS